MHLIERFTNRHTAFLQLIRILEQPAVIDGEHIICVPDHIRVITLFQMQDFIGDLDGVSAPVCIVWGDQDDAAPPSLLAAYEALPAQMPNVAVHVLPGAQHGFMMPTHQGFSASASDFSIRQTLALLAGMNRA